MKTEDILKMLEEAKTDNKEIVLTIGDGYTISGKIEAFAEDVTINHRKVDDYGTEKPYFQIGSVAEIQWMHVTCIESV